ncbi:hypothetical protein [Saccharothrix xinjiangensis]|uniref:Uncharacterized protein n=1 Tax=Saccharothrix xinjiangensis TaxID=204798 RepID=A0ABV9Y1R4_9PSEU
MDDADDEVVLVSHDDGSLSGDVAAWLRNRLNGWPRLDVLRVGVPSAWATGIRRATLRLPDEPHLGR